VLVFVADSCPHCAALVADLERRHVSFTCVDVGREPDRAAELARYTRERRVPVVIDHEIVSVGFRGRSSDLARLGQG
jgi:glutaredoxin